jgi:hypothetical protein
MRDFFTVSFEVVLFAFAFALLAMLLNGYAGLM